MTDDDRAKIKKAGYTYAGGDKLGYQRYSDTFHHDTKDSITVHHEDGKVTKVLKGGNWLGGGSSHKTVADALKEETKLKTFKQFVAEAFDPWADHSGEYQLKKGEAKPTEVHSGQARGWDKAKAPKHIMHVIHKETGEEIGKIEPYSATHDTKKPGARIVSTRKYVTRHSFSFHKGHGPASHEMGTYVYMKHNSPAEALRAMARVHQTHLQKKSESK